MKAVCVIILNWNNYEDTAACLQSLAGESNLYDILVVDNNSGDGSLERLQAEYPALQYLRNDSNYGYAGGNNAGILSALGSGYKYIFILNNDTAVLSGTVRKLEECMEHHGEYGALSPRINYFLEPERSWFSGSALDLAQGVAVHANLMPDRIHSQPVVELPWLSGCALFCRSELLRELNGFDERFFLIWEDVDLSLRMREAGWKLGLVPDALLLHKVSSTCDRIGATMTFYHVRNNLLLIRKHKPGSFRKVARIIIASRVREALRMLKRGNLGAFPVLAAIGRAVLDDRQGRYGMRS